MTALVEIVDFRAGSIKIAKDRNDPCLFALLLEFPAAEPSLRSFAVEGSLLGTREVGILEEVERAEFGVSALASLQKPHRQAPARVAHHGVPHSGEHRIELLFVVGHICDGLGDDHLALGVEHGLAVVPLDPAVVGLHGLALRIRRVHLRVVGKLDLVGVFQLPATFLLARLLLFLLAFSDLLGSLLLALVQPAMSSWIFSIRCSGSRSSSGSSSRVKLAASAPSPWMRRPLRATHPRSIRSAS